jgi:hypothetical protein
MPRKSSSAQYTRCRLYDHKEIRLDHSHACVEFETGHLNTASLASNIKTSRRSHHVLSVLVFLL